MNPPLTLLQGPNIDPSNPQTPSFDERALAVLETLQASLTALLDGAKLGSLAPARVSREAGIDMKLAWKLDRLLDLRAPEAALAYAPGTRALEGLCKVCLRRGASAEAAAAARSALLDFEAFAKVEAGSRKEFDVLLASVRQDHMETDSVNLRRGATEAQASLLGLRADVQFGIIVFRRSEDGSAIDLLNVRGFRGLTCLRRNVAWRVGSSFAYRHDGQGLDDKGPRPLEEIDPASEAPILRRWTTDPIPKMRGSVRPEGVREYILERSEIGASNTIHLALGEIFWGAQELGPGADLVRGIQQLRTPARRVVTDVFVTAGLFKDDTPTSGIYSTIFTGLRSQFEPADLLPIPLDLVPDGGGRKDAWLDELADDALGRVGWGRSGLKRYRFELAYPPVPSSAWMEWASEL